MRKRIAIICGIVVVCLCIAYLVAYFIATSPVDQGAFLAEEFSEYIDCEEFQTDLVYDRITDVKTAGIVGEKAISDRFEESKGSIFEWMGCDVRYDAENDFWHVRTYPIFPLMKGGAYDVILRSDGTVVTIWGEK